MTARTKPRQKPGRSKQDFATPDDFIAAVKRRLGIDEFVVDLAASASNAKAVRFLDEAHDSLQFDWSIYAGRGWCWLNPPFGHIEPWARKCMLHRDSRIAFLVPASTGASWFTDWVAGWARVLFLSPRLSFDGVGPYPKDCILALYGEPPGYEPWDWRKEA